MSKNTPCKNSDKLNEILWDLCLKAKRFIDTSETMGINMQEARGDYDRLKLSFADYLGESDFVLCLGDIYMERQEYDQALETFEKLGSDLPEDLLMKIGDIYVGKKEYNKAAQKFDALLEKNEDNAEAWYKKASLNFISTPDPEDSVFFLERALELNSDYADALILKAKVWFKRSENKTDKFIIRRMVQEGLKCLDKALQEVVDDISPIREFNTARAMALKSQYSPDGTGDYESEIMENLQKALEFDEKEKDNITELIKQEEIFRKFGVIIDEEEVEEEVEEEIEEVEDADLPEDEIVGEEVPEEETLEEETEENEKYKEPESLSVRSIIKGGKEENSNRDNSSPKSKSMEVLSPEELGL